jgi:hypothetical protein
VSNWGDQLYPGVTQHLFREIGLPVEAEYFAPLPGTTTTGVEVRPLRDVRHSEASAVLVGGGDLIRFDTRTVAMDHLSVPHEKRHHRLTRAKARLFAHRHLLDGPGAWVPQKGWTAEAPAVLVSVGVHTIPDTPEVRSAFSHYRAAWARTSSGAARLRGAGMRDADVVLAPDMVFALPDYRSPESTKDRGLRVFSERLGTAEPQIIFQAATFHGWPQSRIESALRSLSGLPVAVLSLGAYSGEDRILKAAAERVGTSALIGLSADDITAVLAASGAVFTTSMHAAIVAGSFGTPVLVPGVKKTGEAFEVCPQPPHLVGVDDDELAATMARVYGRPNEHDPAPNAEAAVAGFRRVMEVAGVG